MMNLSPIKIDLAFARHKQIFDYEVMESDEIIVIKSTPFLIYLSTCSFYTFINKTFTMLSKLISNNLPFLGPKFRISIKDSSFGWI